MTKRSSSAKKPKRTPRKRKKSASARWQIYLLGGSVAFLILLVLMALSGWVGYEMGREEAAKACRQKVTDYRNDLQKLRQKLASQQKRRIAGHAPAFRHPVAKKEEKKTENLSEIRDFVAAGGKESAKPPVKEEIRLKRPKLAIVIDDVAYASQIRAIRSLPWHITPSIFPPTASHPNTPKIAGSLEHFMIHLPMEALNYNSPEDATLTTESSSAEIDLRLRRLREWFPRTHFINNHTGSRFTSDYDSMKRFYPIAKRYGFVFIDSRTTPRTVVPRICKTYHDPYVARDVFLDNEPDIAYIQNQLKKAVKIAKSHGYAIAIGHPHTTTFKALAGSKKILKDVDVVYIDELYGKIR
ncbi:divergent polysaccharide deacetylase family protein [Hydrogenimonas urashimensis]|uniref:divergent polysaccharide deacetylase family protein n=1 Tax=Hydrogenimonas urashimensis TaxID=2740515 RepID=UPI001916C08C|nr:divergent polysaccharide deacetylase family protein [Hydrogenimonas urashimensis]